MSTAARKARKRAGVKFKKPQKVATGRSPKPDRGLGLISGAEIIAAIVIGDLLWKGRRQW